jgi:hypothetical protein
LVTTSSRHTRSDEIGRCAMTERRRYGRNWKRLLAIYVVAGVVIYAIVYLLLQGGGGGGGGGLYG